MRYPEPSSGPFVNARVGCIKPGFDGEAARLLPTQFKPFADRFVDGSSCRNRPFVRQQEAWQLRATYRGFMDRLAKPRTCYSFIWLAWQPG